MTGPWNGTTVTTEITTPLILVQGIWAVEFRNLVGEYACNMGFVANHCWSVRFIDCRMEHCARDPLNASGSSFIQALFNQIHHCDDNAISAHSLTTQSWSLVNNVEIAFNTVTDTPGLSFQGVRRANISGNVIERARQIGIEVAFIGDNLQEGESPPFGVRISGNVITDVINRQNIDGTDTETNYIILGAVPAQAGTAPAVPGTNLALLPGGPAVAERIPSARLWLGSTMFAVGAMIVDGLGNVQQSVTPPSWTAGASVVVGQLVVDGNGNLQRCTAAGTTGLTMPAWLTTVGAATDDGSAVWTCQAVGIYTPLSGTTAPAWVPAYGALTWDGTTCWQNTGANAQYSVTPPYAYFGDMRASGVDRTTPIPPAMSVEISSNHCLRTIDPTANWNYSELGYGQMFTRNGWLDPKLGTVELAEGAGVSIFSLNEKTMIMRSVRILDNVLHGMQVGVAIRPGAVLQGSDIARNHIIDFSSLGVHVASPQAPPTRLLIADNLFDGDPYFLCRGNATGGTWEAGLAGPNAIQFDQISGGVTYERNRHRNLLGILATANFPPGCLVRHNVVACNPTAIGYSSQNVGVAAVPAGGPAFTHMIEDGNPADVAMDSTLTAPPVSAGEMPSDGTYVEGLFVWNTTPAVSNGQVLLGWLRLTTGSSNIAETDWATVFATSG